MQVFPAISFPSSVSCYYRHRRERAEAVFVDEVQGIKCCTLWRLNTAHTHASEQLQHDSNLWMHYKRRGSGVSFLFFFVFWLTHSKRLFLTPFDRARGREEFAACRKISGRATNWLWPFSCSQQNSKTSKRFVNYETEILVHLGAFCVLWNQHESIMYNALRALKHM